MLSPLPPLVIVERTECSIYTSLRLCFYQASATGWDFCTGPLNGFIISLNREGWRRGILEARIKIFNLFVLIAVFLASGSDRPSTTTTPLLVWGGERKKEKEGMKEGWRKEGREEKRKERGLETGRKEGRKKKKRKRKHLTFGLEEIAQN